MKKSTIIISLCALIPMVTGLTSCGKGKEITNEQAIEILKKIKEYDYKDIDYVYKYYSGHDPRFTSKIYDIRTKAKKDKNTYYQYRCEIKGDKYNKEINDGNYYFYEKDNKYYIKSDTKLNETTEHNYFSLLDYIRIESHVGNIINPLFRGSEIDKYDYYSSGEGNIVFEYVLDHLNKQYEEKYIFKNYKLYSYYINNPDGIRQIDVTYGNVLLRIPK